jgi:Reverse transcriptase (RNA-dependent DNA polymerase)
LEEQDEKLKKAWNKVLEIINMVFIGSAIPSQFGIGILVLIPKGTPVQYRGIALLETIYKLIASIINQRLTNSIEFYPAIHGSRKRRGTGTAIINLKLRMQLAKRTKNPLYMVFLDLKKPMIQLTDQEL